MNPFSRFAFATLCGLVLAIITHLATILMIPLFSERHAAARLAESARLENAKLIAGPGHETWLPRHDPAIAVAACAYDLAEGPFRFTAGTNAPFQSVSLHSRGAGAFFAVTDRAAINSELDIVVMTPEQRNQVIALRALQTETDAEPKEQDPAIEVIAPESRGFAVIRVLAPRPSLAGRALAAARQASCTIAPIEDLES
ncbi:MAG: hypothetical protein EA385_06260 [Salinarimonadaceae bacterium]|nr:MAG: hypothetical protein EA385_06260 [Salinarimonadaceae bacterium]